MLRSDPPLLAPALRRVIDEALRSEGGIVYSSKLFDKLVPRGISMADLLHVCHHWEYLRSTRFEYGEWRYRVEGFNLEEHWMAVVLSVQPDPPRAVVITAFEFARGAKRR